MNAKYPRWPLNMLKNALKNRRIVIVSGARQTGKTTLTKQINNKNCEFVSLDDDNSLEQALQDPKGFVKTTAKTLIIDEIQKAPKLIPAIKMVVDNNNRNGQYLLTGSVKLQTMPTVTESLAGRVKNIRLRPLTIAHIQPLSAI